MTDSARDEAGKCSISESALGVKKPISKRNVRLPEVGLEPTVLICKYL